MARQPPGPGLGLVGDPVQLVERRRGLELAGLQLGGHRAQPLALRADPCPRLLGVDRRLRIVDLFAQAVERLQVLHHRPLLVDPDALPAGGHGQERGGVGDDVVERIQRGGTLLEIADPSQHLQVEPLGAHGVAEVLPLPRELRVLPAEPSVARHHLSAVGLILGNRAGMQLGGVVVVGDLGVVAQRLPRAASGRQPAI